MQAKDTETVFYPVLSHILDSDFSLQDIEHSQRMADRAYHSLLESSDMRRYAADIDQQLSSIVQMMSLSDEP